MASGIFSLYCLDTTPGANSVFAPPSGWVGDDQAYLKLMRWRYKHDLQTKQQMHTIARRMLASHTKATVTYEGQFADQAKMVINGIIAERKRIAAEEAAQDNKKAS